MRTALVSLLIRFNSLVICDPLVNQLMHL